ncbi:MAG TPA: hypothetical protein PLN52_19685 [Opitutaceae bacterium]|nr:hypothetical protein [Opitutaceae bacterium]
MHFSLSQFSCLNPVLSRARSARTAWIAALIAAGVSAPVGSLHAQPSYSGPMPSAAVVERADHRREAYFKRIDEAINWRAGLVKRDNLNTMDMAAICAKLVLREDADLCSRRVIELMKEPGTGPFWMFPVVAVAYLGQDQLSTEAKAAIRKAWSSQLQLRGDTENHWAMYYSSLYLMAELYPNEAGSTWFSGKSSEENLAEARDYLIHWMNLATTVGQGEFNPTHYIGEYAIPMIFIATWSKDPAMRIRAHMMLDWIFADHAASTLDGVLRGANARTDDLSVTERWNALATFFSWILFGNTPTTASYGGWGIYFAVVAKNYEVPEVIYRIAVDRDKDFTQEDLKRSRRRWRYSDVEIFPVYKTNYIRRDYAVGSYQGDISDPIQAHVWDVTWSVPDPRGVHNTMFSLHPISSPEDLQMYFAETPDWMQLGVTREMKPSYDSPDKMLGSSRFERVFQNQDTVIALYDIPAGTRFEHVNGFFSKDLQDLTEDASGWIFARGGNTYLAYRPLAPYTWEKTWSWAKDKGDKRLYSPHRKNGTIVQAASASEFASFADFQAAIRALPLTVKLEPTPSVTFKSLRGKTLRFTYGQSPSVDGKTVDYSKWKLFQGPYLNSEKGSRKLTITHGALERTLDFNTLSIRDRVTDTVAPASKK